MAIHNFLFEYQENLLSSASYAQFAPRKNIPVLISTSHRKSEYLEMCRTKAPSAKIFRLENRFIPAFAAHAFIYSIH